MLKVVADIQLIFDNCRAYYRYKYIFSTQNITIKDLGKPSFKKVIFGG